MIRGHLVRGGLGRKDTFRWRGKEISRLEGLSDAVFAFAVTLLVVSLEVPRTFDELLETMRGFAAFGICFLMLMTVWYWHYIFFRRYGLQDNVTVALNAVLLFLVLFYVYPLKFLVTLLVDWVLGRSLAVTAANGAIQERIAGEQTPQLLLIYSAGYLAVNLTLALLHFRAYQRRDLLELTAWERHLTVNSTQRYLRNCLIKGQRTACCRTPHRLRQYGRGKTTSDAARRRPYHPRATLYQTVSNIGGIAVLSAILALTVAPQYLAWAGMSYFLIWPILIVHGRLRQRQWATANR